MGFSNALSTLFLTCQMLLPVEVSSRSVSSIYQNNSLDEKWQDTHTYRWEQSWKSETKNDVTTITTCTSGNLPPNAPFKQGAASTWSYQYSYSGSLGEKSYLSNSSPSQHSSSFTNSIQDSSPSTSKSYSSSYRVAGQPGGNTSFSTPTNFSKPKFDSRPLNVPKPFPTSNPEPQPPTGLQVVVGGNREEGSPLSPAGPNEAKSGLLSPLPVNVGKHSGDGIPLLNANQRGKSAGGIDIQGWLDAHNNYRSQYGVGSVTWSEELVQVARRQTDSCVWKHTRPNLYGENIAAGQNSPSEVVIAWVEGPNEREGWEPNSPSPTHFTQVVWKATREIGCAVNTCQTVEGSHLPQSPVMLWSCEYHPKGNVQTQYTQNVLAGPGGQPLNSAFTSAFASVDPENPDHARAAGLAETEFSPAP